VRYNLARNVACLQSSPNIPSRFSQTYLPERPSKLAFGKRLSHKFKPKKGRPKQSITDSFPVTPNASHPQVALPVSCAREPHMADHVRTRRITSQPAPRSLLKTRPQTQQSEIVQPARSLSIASLVLPDPHLVYPISAQPSSYDPLQSDEQGDVPRLHRKEPPQLTVRDALTEQWGKLRLPNVPLASADLSTSSSATNFSLPLQSSTSTKTVAAKAAWNRMAVSNPILPSFREEPRSQTTQPGVNRPRQGQTHSEPITIYDDSELDATAGSNRPGGNFENTNFFQSGGLSRQSLNRRRTRKARFLRMRPDHRCQSPDSSSSGSEDMLTPDSSESSESSEFDLANCVAQIENQTPIRATRCTHGWGFPRGDTDYAAQEEQDRLLAEHLQREEDATYRPTASRIAEGSELSAPRAASPRVLSQKSGRLASLRRAITNIGTREHPINLDPESDEPKVVVPERARTQDYVALYGEPMDIDGVSPFHEYNARPVDTPQATSTYVDERTHLRSRDCVVCGDSVHVVDLPSLAECDHRPETCTDCYSGWITAQLQSSSWREAKCPGNKCNTVLSYHEIRLYAQPEIFQQYDTFIARAAFSEDRKS